MIRKAFKLAQTERPGRSTSRFPRTSRRPPRPTARGRWWSTCRVRTSRRPASSARAADVLRAARNPIVLAGHGAARAGAGDALRRFAETLGIPVATTFHGKGVFPDDHPQALGAVGFMRHDYVNFGFDQADVIIAVGYELQEFDPVRINPRRRQEDHPHPPLPGRGRRPLRGRGRSAVGHRPHARRAGRDGRRAFRARRRQAADPGDARRASSSAAAHDDRFPLAPARIVADTREALGREDIVLVDTGALKMWMARLYPTYEPNTCLISNGLSTMAWTLPGAIGAKIARPEARVLVATGDGAFMMNSQEIETALRERIPIVILIWVDDEYGLIKWKMDLELGAQLRHRVRQPRLRRLRRELRRPRLPDRARPTSCCRRCARRWPTTPSR